MIGQKIVIRASRTRDEGTMGFHDYVTHKEDFEVFVKRVTDIANNLKTKTIHSISYPSEDKAVICYETISTEN